MNTGVILFMLLSLIIAIGVFLICVPVHIYKIFSSIFNRTDVDVRYSIYIVMISVLIVGVIFGVGNARSYYGITRSSFEYISLIVSSVYITCIIVLSYLSSKTYNTKRKGQGITMGSSYSSRMIFTGLKTGFQQHVKNERKSKTKAANEKKSNRQLTRSISYESNSQIIEPSNVNDNKKGPVSWLKDNPVSAWCLYEIAKECTDDKDKKERITNAAAGAILSNAVKGGGNGVFGGILTGIAAAQLIDSKSKTKVKDSLTGVVTEHKGDDIFNKIFKSKK